MIQMNSVPRVGEFMKFTSTVLGDYFAWTVTQVTYHESGEIEIWTELLNNIDERGYSFESEEELDEYFNAYLAEGWKSPRGFTKNTHVKAVSHMGVELAVDPDILTS